MPDLVEKYFREDLTEEEDRALTQELLSSDGAAEKFMRLAEEAYVRYGLPKADWEGPIPRILPRSKSWWNPWFGLSVLALGLLAGATYWAVFRHQGAAQPSARLDSNVVPLPSGRDAEVSGHSSRPEIPEVASNGGDSPRTVDRSLGPQGAGPPSAANGLRFITASQDHSPAFSHLSVDVSLSSPATLRVRVLDHHGTPVGLLYEGPVGKGNWSFKWNGRTSDGRAAPPGYYQIEVDSNGHAQSKNVQIR